MEERLSGYVLERELARGAMGVVFLARHETLGRQVAIKLLHASGERDLKRFQAEALALARLRHPNIVAVHEVQLDGPRPFLVLAYIDGESLEEKLGRGGPLPPDDAARLGLALAQALVHAHAEGILHRDLKPANVLLGPEGPLLADFGVARELAQERERLTLTGQLVGTPAYMPPEQAVGDQAAIGPHSDVYGLGATLYHALSGQPPCSGASLMSLIAAVTKAPPIPLRSEIPAPLAAICLRCLAKAPADRYPSAQALADDLARFLAGESISIRPRRLRWQWLALGAALLGLVAGAFALSSAPHEPAVGSVTETGDRTPAPPQNTSATLRDPGQGLDRLRGRPFLLKARPWLEANPDHARAAAVRQRYLEVGLEHPLHVLGPREVNPIAAWFVPILVGRKTQTQILSVEQGAMSFDLWDVRTRERLRRYGRPDYRGQLRYDRARNAAKALDPAGQAHEWLLEMLDFEHNRWFVRDPKRVGRAWTNRPVQWTVSPKKSHMTLAFSDHWVELYEEHEHTLLARLPHPGPVEHMIWTADERRLIVVGSHPTNSLAGWLRSWDMTSPDRPEPAHVGLTSRPMWVVPHPTRPEVVVAADYRIELRRSDTLELIGSLTSPDAFVPGFKSRPAHSARVRYMAFSPNGARLYSYALSSSDKARNRPGELRAWEVDGGKYRHLALISSPGLRLHSLDVSPTGDKLLVVSRVGARKRRRLSLYDVAVPRKP